MRNKTITAPEGANYLSDWMTEIPSNCILSKGTTGCGASTLAIQQVGHTIIAMPFVGLIDNKTAQHPELLGIYGRGDKTQEIKDYIDSHNTIKIATTFDSLRKVCDALEGLGFNPYKDAHLIVDEWHILFGAYDYRHKGMRKLLDTAPLFENATYISATPIERKYFFDEIKHLPEYKVEWPHETPVDIRSHKVNKPLEYMSGICRNKIINGGECNYHIFLNSVEDISSIIRTAKLTPEDTRVICSQSEETLRKNLDKLPTGFTISKALDELKPISFYTSTCFEGQDIIDPNGRTFIVSTGKEHTMVDISTSFIQICGRIRQSFYNDEIVHFYSTNRYLKDVTLEEFEQATYKSFDEAKYIADWLNSAPTQFKPKVFRQLIYINEPYIRVVDDNVIVDRNMANFEIVNYKIVNKIYQSKCNVINELTASGLNVTNDDDYIAPNEIKLLTQARIGFKDLFDLYCEIVDPIPIQLFSDMIPDDPSHYDYRTELIEQKNPLVPKAYFILGKDEVRRLKYHQSNIKRAIILKKYENKENHILTLLENEVFRFPLQTAMSIKEVKGKLQEIYDNPLVGNAGRVAKATDLKKWYEVKEHTKTIDGKSVACMTIIRPKFTVERDITAELDEIFGKRNDFPWDTEGDIDDLPF